MVEGEEGKTIGVDLRIIGSIREGKGRDEGGK